MLGPKPLISKADKFNFHILAAKTKKHLVWQKLK